MHSRRYRALDYGSTVVLKIFTCRTLLLVPYYFTTYPHSAAEKIMRVIIRHAKTVSRENSKEHFRGFLVGTMIRMEQQRFPVTVFAIQEIKKINHTKAHNSSFGNIKSTSNSKQTFFNRMPSIQKVIVFGATGAVGTHLVTIISKNQPSWEITAVSRSSTNTMFADLPNVKVVQGDPNKKEDVLNFSADKDIVYSCIGFPRYERKYWAENWPIIADNLLEGSSQTKGQKLVFCDNLYAYGANQKISSSTPSVSPSSKSKPAIRALLRQKFQARMEQRPNSIVVVGGADFFGPLVTSASFLGDTFTKAILNDRKPIAIGSSKAIHDYCYVPDFSNALYLASISEQAYGRFWICPHSIQGKTMNEIASDIASLAGKKTNQKVQVLPGWSLRLLSPFVPFLGEMVEMLPFWKYDYSVDDSDFLKTFHVSATPYEEALKSYIQFYESQES